MTRKDAEPEAEPGNRQGGHVDRVVEDLVADHPGGHLFVADPRRTQRPNRERDAARTSPREYLRGHSSGERDLVAGPPPDPARRSGEDAVQQDYLPADRQHLNEDAQRKPPGVASLEPPQRRTQTDDLR